MCYLPREIIWIQKLAYKWLAFALKCALERTRTRIRKFVMKRSNIFLLKSLAREAFIIYIFSRFKNICTHTDTSFTLVSFYLSRSVVPKRYTVLESFMIYKWNFIFSTMQIFSHLRAQQIVTHTLFRCLFLHLYVSYSNASLQTLNWLCTCIALILYTAIQICCLCYILFTFWFTVVAFYITTYTIV